MVTLHQVLTSTSRSGPLAETVLSLFAPTKGLVIISLAVKLNHIPGKENGTCWFFLMGEETAFLKIQTYNYYRDMPITPL